MRIKLLQTDRFTANFNDSNLIYVEDCEEHFIESIKTAFGLDDYANRIPTRNVLITFKKFGETFSATVTVGEEIYGEEIRGERGIISVRYDNVCAIVKSCECISGSRIIYSQCGKWQSWSLSCSRHEEFNQDALLYNNHCRLRYTEMVLDYYRMIEEIQNIDAETEDYCRQSMHAIKSFIAAYSPVNFGFFSLAFNGLDLHIKPQDKKAVADTLKHISPQEVQEYKKNLKYFRHPQRWSLAQWNMVCLWDYIIANQLLQAIHSTLDCEEEPPLFLVDAFTNMKNVDAKGYLDAIRALDRQVFIIQTHENNFVRQQCDQIVVV